MSSTIRAAQQTPGPIVWRLGALGLILVWAASAQAAAIYVDKDATGLIHDGLNWCRAYLTVQDALVAATPGTTIRVADGTYTPDQGGGQTPGDRNATFQLKNGVTLEGGYAGCGAPDPDARDIAAYETILSGDLDGDDAPVPCTQDSPDCDSFGRLCIDGNCIISDNNEANSYHVTTGSGTDATAVIDGLAVIHGHGSGAGMYNYTGSPTIVNCRFSGNSAGFDGGGMYNSYNSSPMVTNCVFSANSADEYGGGMYNLYHSSPTVTNCTFSGNSAQFSGGGMDSYFENSPTVTNCTFSRNSAQRGGGMNNSYSNPTVINCAFAGNSAERGGGMYNNYFSMPTVTNCAFSENLADRGGGMYNAGANVGTSPQVTDCAFSRNSGSYGGGMFNSESSPAVTNCTFTGNSAEFYGGGMSNFYGNPSLTNCAFTGNSADYGGGIANWWFNSLIVTNCTFTGNSAEFYGGGMYEESSLLTVTNCILWANSDSEGSDESAQIHNDDAFAAKYAVVNYSIVQGGWSGAGGLGVLDLDPVFVNADGSDDLVGTEDDDLRLLPGSPAIDSADTTKLPRDVADLDGDGNTSELTPRDLAGNARAADDPLTADTGIPVYDVVDMGAYEFQDCNANALADECDLDCLGGKGTCNVPGCGQSFDCNGTDIPDECDIQTGRSQDTDGNGIPDECEDGACCELVSGACAENVLLNACAGSHRTWTEGAVCVEVVCEPIIGACCDLLSGSCVEDIPLSACSGTQQVWTADAACADAECEAITGACCDHDPFGVCTDGLTQAACDCPTCEWEKLTSCSELDCPHASIPTVSEWGLVVLTLLLLTGAKILFTRRAPSA